MDSQARHNRLCNVLGITNRSRTRGASLDTSGEGRGQEGDQLFAAGVRERLGAEHVIHDREPVSWAMTMTARTAASSPPICSARIGSSLRSRSRRNSLRAPGTVAECSRSSNGVYPQSARVLPPVHHDPGEVVGQVPPLAFEQVPHVEGAPDHLGEEPLLGAEVTVDQRGGHAGVRGDLADPGALVALGGEAAGGRLEDGLAGRGGIPPPFRARH